MGYNLFVMESTNNIRPIINEGLPSITTATINRDDPNSNIVKIKFQQQC